MNARRLAKIEEPPDARTEADFQRAAKALFRAHGWRVHHSAARPARQGRYVTSGDPGFPDLVCMRPPHLLALELKHVGVTKSRRENEEQRVWIVGLQQCGVHAYIVNEGAWPMLVDLARHGTTILDENEEDQEEAG